jgi:hypothetical protein
VTLGLQDVKAARSSAAANLPRAPACANDCPAGCAVRSIRRGFDVGRVVITVEGDGSLRRQRTTTDLAPRDQRQAAPAAA